MAQNLWIYMGNMRIKVCWGHLLNAWHSTTFVESISNHCVMLEPD
jgi:hypothetical protein